MTATAARPFTNESGHWYERDGTPAYTVISKSTGLPRPTTLSDARKLGLLPSVTQILRILNKPALTSWLIEQAVLAVLSTPRHDGEAIDAFAHRVLQVERVQDQESTVARDKGTDIHDALEGLAKGQAPVRDLSPWVDPVWQATANCGEVIETERILVGDGYAGRTDLIQRTNTGFLITDYKTTKRLPEKEAYFEAKLQLAAYAKAWHSHGDVRIQNVYISTIEPGRFVIHETSDWPRQFQQGFLPCLTLWQHLNQYMNLK